MRKYSRHTTHLPFDYTLDEVVMSKTEYLKDVSMGGLSFQSGSHIREGTRIRIDISVLDPAFHMIGTVVWCQKKNEHYDIGVKFTGVTSKLQARMVAQVCLIEQYRKHILETQGRELTTEEAAAEWIHKYADGFSRYQGVS